MFGTNAETHHMFGVQLTSECFINTEARGRSVDEWMQRSEQADNHWFDCSVGSAVAASMQVCILIGTDLSRNRIKAESVLETCRTKGVHKLQGFCRATVSKFGMQ